MTFRGNYTGNALDKILLNTELLCNLSKAYPQYWGESAGTWFTLQWYSVFRTTDLPPLVDSVLLELSGLDRNLPLHFHLCVDGSRLPGLHVRGHTQTSAASHLAANAVSGAPSLPQGELGHQYRQSNPPLNFEHCLKKSDSLYMTVDRCTSIFKSVWN